MNDAHLNSIHLEAPRREDFRRARQSLLDGRGMNTINFEKQKPSLLSRVSDSGTMVEERPGNTGAPTDFWLMDGGGMYPLKVGVNTIGRLPDNDVVIQGPYVSRRHCAILVHVGSSCELYDIASKNGTFVNGAKLTGPTRLRAGDEIRMCDRQFVFMSKRCRDGGDYDHTRSE